LNTQEKASQAACQKENGSPLLETTDLMKYYKIRRGGWLARKKVDLKAVDGVSFSVNKCETFGIVGESGCGKSTIARLVLNIDTPTSGSVLFKDRQISGLPPVEWRKLRRRMQYVFQDPLGALDPRMKILDQVAEPLLIHNIADTFHGLKGSHLLPLSI